mgnify:CR=1 FL=1
MSISKENMVETLTKQKIRRRSKGNVHHGIDTSRHRRLRFTGDSRDRGDSPHVLNRQSVPGEGILSRMKASREYGASARNTSRRNSSFHRDASGFVSSRLSKFGTRFLLALDKIANRLSEHVRGMDLAVLLAAVTTLFALNVVLSPSQAFSRVVTRPADLSLPGVNAVDASENMLSEYLSPTNDYDVIGGTVNIDSDRFESVEVQEHELERGDTLLGLALEYDLNMDTIVSFNGIQDVRLMQIGDVYEIPNRDGLLYSVKQGDSLASIAERYDTTSTAILDANDLASSEISPGQVLFVPNARMDEDELKLILGELFLHPMRGRYTDGFGMRNDPFTGIRRMHYGLDIASYWRAPIKAARAGRVAHIESQPGNYGKFVILRHPGGYQTLYAHLDSFNVSVGQYVNQGQVIGRMGNTGRSTGPHLHFSIIKNGSFIDPMEYLH